MGGPNTDRTRGFLLFSDLCAASGLASSEILLQPGLWLDFFPKQKNFSLFSPMNMKFPMEENILNSCHNCPSSRSHFSLHHRLSTSCRDRQQEKTRFLGRNELGLGFRISLLGVSADLSFSSPWQANIKNKTSK